MNRYGFLKPKINTGFDLILSVLVRLTLWIQLYPKPSWNQFKRQIKVQQWMTTRGSCGKKKMGGGHQKMLFFFSICSKYWWFQIKRFTRLLEFIKLYILKIEKFSIFTIYQLYIGFNFFSLIFPPEYGPRLGIKWKRI